MSDETQLLARAQTGDEAAFAALFEAFRAQNEEGRLEERPSPTDPGARAYAGCRRARIRPERCQVSGG